MLACFALMFALIAVTGCEQQSVAPPDTVEITVQYPTDYYTVLSEPKKTECPSKIVLEKQIEQKAQEIVARQQVMQDNVKKQAVRQQKQQWQSYQDYLKTRSELVRVLRRNQGGSFLTKQDAIERKRIQKTKQTKTLSAVEKSYAAPNIISSFPVDRSFILTEDRTISAVLLDSINSQIAGSVRAMVSEDVFGADNRYKLLEKGDVIIGRYEKTSKVGETRLGIYFYRILRAADGAEVYASGSAFAYAADKMGRTGLIGDVDNRNWERYGLAFSTSLIGGIAGLGKAKVDGDEFEEFWNRLSDNTTEITTKILEQYMNIAPVITIAQGEPILVRLATDITLKQPTRKD